VLHQDDFAPVFHTLSGTFMTESSLSIGVDLGATKIAAILASSSGKTLAVRQTPTLPQRGVQAVLDDIGALIEALAAEASAQPEPLVGIGIGSPGLCDPINGVVYNAVNLSWVEVQLAAEVSRRLQNRWPVWIQKDANASALGEYYFGAARGCSDFVCLTVGSGLGGGIMANGALITGENWNAAEVGHISLDPLNGRLCACGLRGCAETVASGPGLSAVAMRLVQEGKLRSSFGLSECTPARILAAAQQNEELALAALEQVGAWLGIVASACLALLNPGRLIIGGGLGIAAFDFIIPSARAEIQRRVLPASYQRLEILPSRLESSAMGAASAVWYALSVNSKERR
jgi:glucokinase